MTPITLVLTGIVPADKDASAALMFAVDGDKTSGLAFVSCSEEQAAACKSWVGATLPYAGTYRTGVYNERPRLWLDAAPQLSQLKRRAAPAADGMPPASEDF